MQLVFQSMHGCDQLHKHTATQVCCLPAAVHMKLYVVTCCSCSTGHDCRWEGQDLQPLQWLASDAVSALAVQVALCHSLSAHAQLSRHSLDNQLHKEHSLRMQTHVKASSFACFRVQ